MTNTPGTAQAIPGIVGRKNEKENPMDTAAALARIEIARARIARIRAAAALALR